MDFHQSLLRDYNSLLRIQKTYCELVAKVHNFSDEGSHHADRFPDSIDYYTTSINFKNNFFVKVYANGSSCEDKGFISICFGENDEYHSENIINYFDFTCVISVLDVDGSKRFSQSFTYEFSYSPPDNKNILPVFGFDKYISRETLLRESSDLLPEDTLTIHMEVNIAEHLIDLDYSFDIRDYVQNELAYKAETDDDGVTKYYLSLNSELALHLCLVSSYFRRMAATPMTEREEGFVSIPSEEFPYFMSIWLILNGSPFMIDRSGFDISRLYAIADKYNIPVVLETCRQMMKRCLSLENVNDLSELADRYNDDSLKQFIKAFVKNNEENTEAISNMFGSNQDHLKTEWSSKPLGMHLMAVQHFKVQQKQSVNDEEENRFSFYS